jgi:hypothetical protein
MDSRLWSAAGTGWFARRFRIAVVVTATVVCGSAAGVVVHNRIVTPAQTGVSASPPPPAGYFRLRAAGSWSTLPADQVCASRVHRSKWEPRPMNSKRNHVMPDEAAVHQALLERPRNTTGAYDPRWDSWLLPRVTGHFRGTTDEILQWAACKWGLPDNLLRAIAVRESNWYQYPTYLSGRCVAHWGCGDSFSRSDEATKTYCQELARYGYDYQGDDGLALCPKTFSIMGVMAWQAPDWGPMLGNQNGTFPFSRDSTAYAADYVGAYLRGCLEGWEVWLAHTGNHRYTSGQLWGCVGSWYSGSWHGPAGNTYIANVRREWRSHTWLKVVWPLVGPGCSADYGCISTDPLKPRNG